MEWNEVKVGDRLLIRANIYKDDITEVTVVEIGIYGIKLRYAESGSNLWHSNKYLENYIVAEKLESTGGEKGELTLAELQKEAWKTAEEKGWHVEERTPLEIHALMHSEISEATEQVREGRIPIWRRDEDHERKPEGEAIELADGVIRIAEYFQDNGWDLTEAVRLKMEYNKTRPYRHGGKLK